jgi:ATP-dependent HslUV protease, peptidase subunit HslV
MSTIVVVQKNGVTALGADTMSSLGSLRQRARHVVNKTKITWVGDTCIGLTGTSASLVVMNSYFANPERLRDFSSTAAIFETFRHAHHHLKTEYFMAAHPDKDDEYETTQFYGLAANPHGIFALYSFRSAQQFQYFWAAGSGRDYALGAMHQCYNEGGTAGEIAQRGLEAAAEFDSATAGPFEIYSIPMKMATAAPTADAAAAGKSAKKSAKKSAAKKIVAKSAAKPATKRASRKA